MGYAFGHQRRFPLRLLPRIDVWYAPAWSRQAQELEGAGPALQRPNAVTPSRSRLKFTSRPLRSGAPRARARSRDRLSTWYVMAAAHCGRIVVLAIPSQAPDQGVVRSQVSTERSWFKVSRFCCTSMKYFCDRRTCTLLLVTVQDDSVVNRQSNSLCNLVHVGTLRALLKQNKCVCSVSNEFRALS